MRIDADINQSILDARSRREAMEFESFIKGEAAKRAMAWGLEKTELSQQHDFEMQIQRKDLENQLAMDKGAREEAKLQTKITALKDAHERGDISEKDMNDNILRVETGREPLSAEEELFQDALDKRKKEEEIQKDPLKRSAAALRSLSGTLNESDKKDVEAIIEEGNVNKIKQTLDILQARAEIEEGPGIIKSMVPVLAVGELIRLNRLKRQAGVPKETQRPRTPEFSPFRQSMGSFR